MGNIVNEKMFGAEINTEICDLFLFQSDERGFKKKKALEAALRLWTELPIEAQARLLSKTDDSSSFIDLVKKIIDDYWTGQIQMYPKKKEKGKISKKTIRQELRDFVEKTRPLDEKGGERITVSPSDEKLWNTLRDIAGVDEKGKKIKEG